MQYVPALDGLRGIAVLLVVGVHTRPGYLNGGNIGVDIFFVLSGFLITLLLLSEFQARGAIDIKRFYRLRCLRLFPALALLLFSTWLYVAIAEPDQLARTIKTVVAVATYIFNFYLIGLLPNIFDHQQMLMHLWSLSVEEQFYLLWPVIIIACLRSGRPNALPIVIALGIALSTIWRILAWHIDMYPGWKADRYWVTYLRTDFRVDTLMWGASLAWVIASGWKPSRLQRILPATGAVAIAFLFIAATRPVFGTGLLHRYGSFVSIATVMCIASIYFSEHTVLSRILSVRPLVFTGRISYGLYLWHLPITLATAAHGPLQSVVAILLSYMIATISYAFMERPLMGAPRDRLNPNIQEA